MPAQGVTVRTVDNPDVDVAYNAVVRPINPAVDYTWIVDDTATYPIGPT